MPSRRSNVLTPQYSFDVRTGRYHDNQSNRFVKHSEVVSALETQVIQSRQAMNQATDALRNNKLSLTEWRSEMVTQIKTLHVAQYAAGQGGWARMNQSDYGRIGNILKEQYHLLNGFTHDLQEDMFSGHGIDGRASQRAELYANAAYATFEESRKQERYNSGMSEERRVLGAAEHCDDCIEYAERDWQPIFTLPAIGDSICRNGCQCSFEYR